MNYELGRWESGEIELKPQNPNPQHLKPDSYLLTPISMVDVGFLQEFYFPTKISKTYLLTPQT
jgi:hypothetical protein